MRWTATTLLERLTLAGYLLSLAAVIMVAAGLGAIGGAAVALLGLCN